VFTGAGLSNSPADFSAASPLSIVIHVSSAIHVRDGQRHHVRKAKTRNALHDLPLKLLVTERFILARRADAMCDFIDPHLEKRKSP
jgi:hypothetical protein